jgi:hypothetical protein
MNPDPVTVTSVSPAVEPDTGDNDTTDGATATYAKSSAVPDADEVPPEVVTVTSTVPGVIVDGDVTVSEVGDDTVAATGARPSKATVAPVTKPVPVIVTDVPPVVGPVLTDSDVTVGTGAVYENPVNAADAVPVEFVTTMFAVPVVMVAGTTMSADVAERTVTDVAATPRTVTVIEVVKSVPVSRTVAPPADDADVGEAAVTVEAPTPLTLNDPPVPASPAGLATRTTAFCVTPLGVTAVICVAEFTVKLAASSVPKRTLLAPQKLVPVTTTIVPPVDGPVDGAMEVTVGVP